MEKFFATCPRGLEQLLAEELQQLKAENIRAVGGGVEFSGDFPLCYRANLESRIASRILWQVATDRYRNEDDIYRTAYALPWNEWFEPERTIRVDVSAIRCPLKSLNFVTLKIKDAVCDKIRRLSGRRPSVDTRQPDIPIQGHLTERDFTLYLDTTGDPLFKRGRRIAQGEAPLRENLAAGILRLAGWTPGIPLLDPMCGSGTLLIEAAQIARGIPAGRNRRFAFENLRNFDAAEWVRIRDEAEARISNDAGAPIFGSDLFGDALKLARENLAAAGLADAVVLKQANVLEISAPAAEGVLVTNPPYGVRLGEQEKLAAFYPQLGNVLKKKFAGWRAYLFTADLRLPKLIGLSPSKRTPLYNGPLECRLYEFRMVAGSMRKKAGGVRS